MPFSEHDLDHQTLKFQVHLLQQFVLKLFVVIAKDLSESDPDAAKALARALVSRSSASLKASLPFPGLHTAERQMFDDQAAEILHALDEHLEFILRGDL